jgi:hypothetical protein
MRLARLARRWTTLVLLALLVLPLGAQRGGGRRGFGTAFGPGATARYDGRFTLARLYYARYTGWSFDWPDMESHLNSIINDLTTIRPQHDLNNVFRMDDPELMKFPIAYLSEPGYWFPTEAEAAGLRTYLHKGGFLIVDDFHFPEEWSVFESAMKQVLPEGKIVRLSINHPVFNSFFPIRSLDVPYPGRLGQMGLMGEFFGIYDTDPSQRLMVVINYNMDIGDYMEHSPSGLYAVAPTNEAYKFGINYLIYGFTH